MLALAVAGDPHPHRPDARGSGPAPRSPTTRVGADEWRARAEAAYASGDHGTALVDGFRALAVRQVERGLLDDAPGATAHELAVALRALHPGREQQVDEGARLFDLVLYGDRVGHRGAGAVGAGARRRAGGRLVRGWWERHRTTRAHRRRHAGRPAGGGAARAPATARPPRTTPTTPAAPAPRRWRGCWPTRAWTSRWSARPPSWRTRTSTRARPCSSPPPTTSGAAPPGGCWRTPVRRPWWSPTRVRGRCAALGVEVRRARAALPDSPRGAGCTDRGLDVLRGPGRGRGPGHRVAHHRRLLRRSRRVVARLRRRRPAAARRPGHPGERPGPAGRQRHRRAAPAGPGGPAGLVRPGPGRPRRRRRREPAQPAPAVAAAGGVAGRAGDGGGGLVARSPARPARHRAPPGDACGRSRRPTPAGGSTATRRDREHAVRALRQHTRTAAAAHLRLPPEDTDDPRAGRRAGRGPAAPTRWPRSSTTPLPRPAPTTNSSTWPPSLAELDREVRAT